MSKEMIIKIYDSVIEGNELTTKLLKEYGFNSYTIQKLIAEKVIIREKIGHYSFIDYDNLYYYYRELIKYHYYEKAYKCLEICYQHDENNFGVCFRLFIESIKNRNYERAFILWNKLSKRKNQFYLQDLRYYLFLLNYIIELPEYIKENPKEYNIDDVKVFDFDSRYFNAVEHNNVRLLTLHGEFLNAIKYFKNHNLNEVATTKMPSFLTKELLTQAYDVYISRKNYIEKLVKDKKYEELVEYLNDLNKRINFKKYDKCILKLSKLIISLKNGSNIPQINENNSNTVFDAIDNNNFKLALSLNHEYCNKYNLEENTLGILLNDIINIIKDMQNVEEQNISFKELLNILYSSKSNLKFFLDRLSIYLKSINQSNYEFLVTNLFKISLIKNDITYSMPLNVLLSLNKNTFDFNISDYLEDFYLSLNEGKIEEAKIYFDIIKNANDIFSLNIKVYILENQLLNVSLDKEDISNSVLYNESNNNYSKEKSFVSQKYQELQDLKGLIIISDIEPGRIDDIIDCASEYVDIEAFTIENDGKQDIALIQREIIIDKNYNKDEYYHKVSETYHNQDYEATINTCLQILSYGDLTDYIAFVLGYCYMYTNNTQRAIDYFTIANYLVKKYNKNFNYDDIINRLKGIKIEKNYDDEKPYFIVSESLFTNYCDYYGIDFKKVHELVMQNGYNIYNACISLNISDEDISIVYLIYAREFYLSGDLKNGDLLLKIIENKKNKTQKVIKILDELRRNKKLYACKNDKKEIELSLKLINNAKINI